MHVETDPSIIWAGMPPWIGAGFLVPPDADVDGPPLHCPDWRAWLKERGGIDERTTQVRVTLTAREELLVVIDAIRVRIHERTAAPQWRQLTCGVGGADISPRRGEIDLSLFDPPAVEWIDEDGQGVGAPTFSLASGEAEMLHLWANVADDQSVAWTAEILAIVDGKRQVVEVSDGGKPFVTAGSANAISSHMAVSGSGEWNPPL